MAVDKGAITDSHVLVLPIEHWPSSLHLSASAYAEMERYLSALRSCFAAKVQLTRLGPLRNWATALGRLHDMHCTGVLRPGPLCLSTAVMMRINLLARERQPTSTPCSLTQPKRWRWSLAQEVMSEVLTEAIADAGK